MVWSFKQVRFTKRLLLVVRAELMVYSLIVRKKVVLRRTVVCSSVLNAYSDRSGEEISKEQFMY